MDKTFIYGLFKTLTISAAGRYPKQKNYKKIFFSKNRKFFTKNKLKISKNKVFFLKIDYWYRLPADRLSTGS
jgi:hypothetical protein